MSLTESITEVEWREVPGFDGAYRVSDRGDVESCLKQKSLGYGRGSTWAVGDTWHRLTPSLDTYGYMVVQLGHRNRRKIHQLVLAAFVGPCPAGMQCRHLNGDRADNRPENLKWGTPRENAADQERHGTKVRGEAQGLAKLTEADVLDLVARHEAGETVAAIARSLDVDKSTIYRILNGETWRHVTERLAG